MSRLCLITDAYPPEIRSASVLMEELAHELARQGNDVTVLTTSAKYNLTRMKPQPALGTSTNSVEVLRVPSFFLHNVGLVKKALGQIWLPFPIAWSGIFHRRFDAVLAYTPPLTLAIAALAIARRHKAKAILNVQDLFPQNAIDLGALKSPVAIRIFRALERFAYKHSDSVVVHSEGNAGWLGQRGWAGKVSVVPNWFDFSPILRDPERSALAALPAPRKFTAFFGGVLGYAQDLDVILDAARELRHEAGIQFLLVGDGVDKERALARANTEGCTNVIFRGFVDPPAYRLLLGSVDVGLATLRKTMRTPVVPNKVLGFLAAELPVVTALNEESDARRIVEESRAGINVPAGDGKALANAVHLLFQNSKLRIECGRHGRLYGLANYGVRRAVLQYTPLWDTPPHY